ncbi:MAG: Gfo/Idh/MocA family oxidoreductase [Nitrospira sp.]|nr:Gfo/Idh/MocA family oxidoreductase [Nitrospira sp.]
MTTISPTMSHLQTENQGIQPAPAPPPMKVAIIGAGRGGMALLDVLHQIRTIQIVGIADQNPSAPGLKRAQELHVPVYDGIADLITYQGLNLVMDVTGDPAMESALQKDVPAGTASLAARAT